MHSDLENEIISLVKENEELRDEIHSLKQGLYDCAIIAGVDTDGDYSYTALKQPDIVVFAHRAVYELNKDYDEACKELWG